MTRARLLLVAALSLCALLLASPSAFAQVKFAVVDVQRAVGETEDGLRAQAALKKFFDKKQQELDAKQNALQKAKEDLDKQARVLSQEALARKNEQLQRDMVELQGMLVEFNKELQRKQTELTQPIFNKVMTILRQVAAQDGYDAIFEKNAVPYSRSDLDITDKAIQIYNAGSPKAPADKPSADDKKAPAPKQPPAAKPAPAAPPKPAGGK